MLALLTGHEGAESVGARAAAAVAARARRRAEVEEQYVPRIDTMLAAKDSASAARLQEQMETRIKTRRQGRASLRPQAMGAAQKPRRTPWALARLWPRVAGPGARRSMHR